MWLNRSDQFVVVIDSRTTQVKVCVRLGKFALICFDWLINPPNCLRSFYLKLYIRLPEGSATKCRIIARKIGSEHPGYLESLTISNLKELVCKRNFK